MFRKTTFLSAAEKGNLSIISKYIQNNTISVETKDKDGYTALLNASYYGHLPIVQYLIQHGNANVNAAINTGHTTLHIACQKGEFEIVQYLIQHGKANVEATTNEGPTPLFIACQKGHLPIVQYLMEHGNANVEAPNNNGATPLYIACERNYLPIVQYLLQHGNVNVNATKNDGTTPLYIACELNHLPIVQCLIQQGNANVEASMKGGYTPLYIGCQNGHLEIVKYLVQHGNANVNATMNDGRAALPVACHEGHLEIVQYLVQHGNANVEAPNNNGATPLYIACEMNHLPVAQFLIEHGHANVEATKDGGYTALYIACHNGHLPIVQYLNEVCGARTNVQAKDGSTPLSIAKKNNKMDVVIYLKSYMKQASLFLLAAESGNFNTVQEYIQTKKVHVETKNDETGWTALHYACQSNHVKIIQFLLQYGNANVNAITNDGNTALHNACDEGNLAIVLVLVQEGNANVETANDNNWTPLHIACQKGHVKIVKFLLHHGRANIDSTTNDGSTALHIASINGHLPVVQYLIQECGAKINDRTKFGDTPLDLAKESNKHDVAIYLNSLVTQDNIDNKIKQDDQNHIFTATNQVTKRNEELKFLSAAEIGDLCTIQQCVENKTVNVDAKNDYGWTALYYSSWYGHLQIVQYLLQQGNANVNATTDTGHTALHFASQNGHLDIVQYLVKQAKANVQACTDKGGTAIHIACQSGHLHIVQYLIEHCGASTNDHTKNGKTPLDVAIENDKKDIIAYLKTKMEELQFKSEDQYSNLGSNNNTENVAATNQEMNDKMIESDRNQLLKLVNDPSLEPFSISLQYINECTSNFTSKLLGEGAFGKVYYGSDKILGLQLAIKKVPLQVMDKETLDQITLSFRREISVLKRFRHPNIVILYGFNVEVGQSSQVLVYEYLNHGPLSGFLTSSCGRTRLSATTRLSIMYQVARSINFLHKGGVDNLLILHRDIKSGNICLTHDYAAKLIDCGLAKFVDKDSDETQKGSVSPTMLKSSGLAVFGTPGYICPVYSRGNLKYNEACDMYSVGIVMAELIVGCLQSNQSSRGEQSFGDYFNRYIRDDDEEPVVDGWQLLMEDADPDAGWSDHNIENLCKLAIQCMIPSPKKRMLSTELMDSLFEISRNEFNIGYEHITGNVEDHKIRTVTKQVKQVEIDDHQPKPCVLCFKFNNIAQYVMCKKGHIMCTQCIEQLVQTQIGKSGGGVSCDIDRCNGSFDDDALFGKVSPSTYNRYIVERKLQSTAEKHLLEVKELILKQQELLVSQHQDNHEKATIRHCEMIKSLQSMGSMIDATAQRTLHALAYLATENIQKCPTLVWLVPSDRSAGRNAKDWIKWAKTIAYQTYDLYFICQHSYTVVEPKMEIRVSRQWLIQAGPVLQLSMLLIKAGLTAVTGVPALPFPIPNLSRRAQITMSEEFVSSLIDDSTQHIMNAFEIACSQNSDLPHLESSQLLTLTGVGYELIVEKATKLKRSQWKESMQPVMNQYGKLIWVKKEYVREVMKTKKLEP